SFEQSHPLAVCPGYDRKPLASIDIHHLHPLLQGSATHELERPALGAIRQLDLGRCRWATPLVQMGWKPAFRMPRNSSDVRRNESASSTNSVGRLASTARNITGRGEIRRPQRGERARW